MKQIKFPRLFFAAIMLAVLFVTGCAKEDANELPPVEKGKVTFIYYSQVDDNLAEESKDQLSEIQRSCKAGYRCLAMANFPKEYRKEIAKEMGINVVGTLTFGIKDDARELLFNSGETATDMSKSETFAELLNTAVELYPADEYVVIFNGHGAGWEYTEDGTRSTPAGDNTMNGLTVRGISQAIKSSAVNGKVKLIYFDACLMAGYEYLGDLASCTPYIIGTPTVSWTAAGKTEKLINLVKGTPNWNGTPDWERVAKAMAFHLNEVYEGYWAISVAVKTEGTPALLAKIKRMNELLNTIGEADEDKREAIADASTSSFAFLGSEDPNPLQDMRDLNDFYYRLQTIDATLEQPYADFVAALDQVVIADYATSQITGHADGNSRYGLSMLFVTKQLYDEYIKNTLYKDLIFTKETNPEKLFSLFD